MATTFVISPTTNTMLKIVLYNGYLKPSFLMQDEIFAEIFSAPGRVKLSLLYILGDKEWKDVGCLLCTIAISWKDCLKQWIHHEWRVKHRTVHSALKDNPLIIKAIGTKVSSNTTVHVREDRCTWSTWFPSLSWCSYFGGYLLPEDRDSGWSVLPSPCPVSQRGWTHTSYRLRFTYSDKLVTQTWLLFTQKVLSHHQHQSPQKGWWHIHTQVRFLKRCLGGKNPVSLSKFSPLFLFFFGSKAENLSLAFHLAKKVLTTNHQAPAWEHNWSVGWTAAQVCHNVSVFHYLSSGSVSCPLPPSLSLSFSYWVTSSSLSLSLSSLSLFFPLTASGALTQHTSCTQTVLLLLCAGIADSFCTLNGRESSCRNHSHCFPSNSSYSFVCWQLKEESTQTTLHCEGVSKIWL